MRKLWLVFAQAVTICLAALFVLQLFYPQLLKTTPALQPQQATLANSAPKLTTASVATTSFRQAVQKATPSVVNIFTSKVQKHNRPPFMDDPLFQEFFGNQLDTHPQKENSLGSGVIVDVSGLILTNNHVVASADQIEVALSDGKTYPAKLVGTDPDTDLAVLKVDAKNLPAITFADTDQVQTGDIVLAIGNPFGFGQTVTQGIVSALSRNHLGINTFENFIQTDAAINPGNSGGALVDINGNLIGINSVIYSRSGGSMGIGFAIPANLAKQIMQQIIHQGSVTRGWVGIEAQDVTPALAESFGIKGTQGAIISNVLSGSPAQRAGLRPGDVILSINGTAVKDGTDMLNQIVGLVPDKTATINIQRGGKPISVEVTIGKRPKQATMQQEPNATEDYSQEDQ